MSMTPREIVHELNRHIIGQDDAKRAVAIALRNRWRRMQLPAELRQEVTPKNILMIGPTGVGKTEIARRLAKLANAPFLKVEATKFTEVGYVGRDVESIIRDLADAALKMLREQEVHKMRHRAEDAAEERILDALLPPARPVGFSEEPVQSGDSNTRQLFRKRLREGQLDDKEIDIEVAESPAGVEIMAPPGMEEMTMDMGGAGVVAGVMRTLALRRARANVVGLVGLVENMPDGKAQRPGDIVRSMKGDTIEVVNTDAEGRMVLADVLWYAQDRFQPAAVVNLATLTGAVIIALGHDKAGLFSNDDGLAERLAAAGKAVGEKLWRMPLSDAYDKALRSDIADMKNIGGRPGGSITAAQFLQRFTNGKRWAHLDIAGTAWNRKDEPTVPKGATAFGVRLLDRLVAEHHEPR